MRRVKKTEGTFVEISYQIKGGDGVAHTFIVRFDRQTLEQKFDAVAAPAWAALETDKCAGCPLNVHDHPFCPAARSLAAVIPVAIPMVSYSRVEVEVAIEGRVVHAEVTVQDAMSSLIGLCMATSGCPNLAFLKPMARFHVPFATMAETIFRATSSFLLGRYFQKKATGEENFSLSGLESAYGRLHEVNVGMARRLRRVSEGDANLNAIVKLDMFAQNLPYAIRDELESLAPYYIHVIQEKETLD